LQLRVLRLGFFQDRDVGVGVFPQSEEVLVRSASLRSVALESVGACQTEMRQCAQREVPDDTWMVKELLELRGCGAAVVYHQVGLTAHVDRRACLPPPPQFVRGSDLY
jgi:hypothetical protein